MLSFPQRTRIFADNSRSESTKICVLCGKHVRHFCEQQERPGEWHGFLTNPPRTEFINKPIEIMATNPNPKHDEGPVAEAIEEQTAKLPSDLFLWAALGSMAVSLFFKFKEENDKALFVGQWAAPFLLLGLYNKLVKLEGHD